MRPVWMRIKGLNSFLDSQDIDFAQLTREGLFGIFGPTGSGKSSILDGITLALFGTTSRNSGNFINVNTDRASVDYVFAVREKTERKYQVSRSFKRSKEGNIRSDSARFLEITGETPQILADKVGTVNEKCREIIGLSREDFFRTVVLPQGKFSEFLKLEGMERNKMLERLFHLEKYGEGMTVLIKSKEAQWDGQKREKEGALSRYGEVNQEQIDQLQAAEKENQTIMAEKEKELKAARTDAEENRKILLLQKEYHTLLLEKEKQETRRTEIQGIQEQIKDAEKANQLLTYVLEAEQAEIRKQEAAEKQENISISWKQKRDELALLENKKQQAEQQIQTEKPSLTLQQVKLQEAVRLSEEKKGLEKSLQAKTVQAELLGKELKTDLKKMEGLLEDIESRREQKELWSQELQEVTVSALVQQAAEEGYRLVREVQQIQKREAELQKKLLKFSKEKKETEENYAGFQKKIEEYKAVCQKLEEEILEISRQQKALAELDKEREVLLNVRTEQEKSQLLLQNMEKQKRVCIGIEKELKQNREKKDLTAQKKAELEKLYIENLAGILAADLQEGAPCPVCGSRHHVMEYHGQEQRDLKELINQKRISEEAYQTASGEVTRLETRLEKEKEIWKEQQKEHSLLKEEYLQQDFMQLQKSLEEKTAQKQRLEKMLEETENQLKKLQETLHSTETQKAKNEAALDNLEIRIKESREEAEIIESEKQMQTKQLKILQQRCKVTDFESFYEEIQNKNMQREEKQKALSLLEKALDARIKNREKGEGIIQEKQTKKAEYDLQIKQLAQGMEDLTRQIEEKAGSEKNLKQRCEDTEKRIQKIDQDYEEVIVLWDKIQKEENSLHQEYAAQEALAKASLQDSERKKVLLWEKMEGFQIQEKDWVLKHKKEESELLNLRREAEDFKEVMMKLSTRLEGVREQLKDKKISEEQVKNSEEQVKVLEGEITERNKKLGAVKKELEQIEKAWKEKQMIQTKLEHIYHKLDILSELEGLFRGKRFVEYVSRYYLEYVSREADHRLKEMTGSCYGLETDGNGMFVIRDYKNGGVPRPASTLSGGETFMASLALALALSSQIQMKGAAPLELFFLDEGFGTLDENCLEVVMESLEKIRSSRRSVGVISHVEAIKARIPMQLVVEPAKPGEGGSKIHIEQM